MIQWTVKNLADRGWRIHENHTNGRGQTLMLCPWYDFDKVPNETQFWHVDGRLITKGRDVISWESKAGILGYGVWV